MGRRPKYTFSQRRHKDGQEAHEKMFNITDYQRNANPNYNDISNKDLLYSTGNSAQYNNLMGKEFEKEQIHVYV